MVGKSKDKALTPKEREVLENNLKDTKHQMILFLGAYAGLRVSEMIQCRQAWLEWVEIENLGKILAINIPVEDSDVRNKFKRWTPKSKAPKTHIDNLKNLPNELSKELNLSRTTYIFESNIAHSVWFWFDNNEDGISLSRQNITTIIVKGTFAKLLRRLPSQITTHALRATFQNYIFFEKNFDIKFCQLVLGHQDDRTTMKHYTSLTKESGISYLTGKYKESNP